MKLNRFAKYACVVLAFNLAVIAWGAYVRASGSGAGCGSHWPLCNGEIIPRAPTLQTLIEYSHRLTSGLALLLVAGLIAWAFRAYERGHAVRRWAFFSGFFILTEALVGAGLVLFEYVAENKSSARALWMSGHLINTFLMLGAFTLTLWAAIEDQQPQPTTPPKQDNSAWLLTAALAGTLILGVSGAITALGATLFPVTSLAEGLQQDLSPTSHLLIRLRFYHPLIALFVSTLLAFVANTIRAQRPSVWTNWLSISLIVLVVLQLTVGISNLLLHAPTWLQLVHLLLSDLIWIALVLLTAAALTPQLHSARLATIEAAATA
ncbi:MAG: COX15/CtaA family protein [Acidobacteria bacterium]|nr:COX15/CtaA family protein [Acidobacteriota bacterium]MBI3421909.1 COX15/CtaA family protein [Acidobacteriota bacterium]